jgi:diguanylate cyclase (GGDEF)-like protein
MGKSIFEFLILPEEKVEVERNLQTIQKNENMYLFINSNLTKEGKIIKCEWYNTLLPLNENEEQEIVSQAIDITKKDLEEKLLKKQALHDPLTTLPNRHYFEMLLKDKLIESKINNNNNIVVGFIDLDKFKEINDTIGHEAGDFLLQNLAQQFLDTVANQGKIARIGGDEFVFFLHNLSSWENIISKLLQKASDALTYENHIIKISASIGVYMVDISCDETISEILKKADTAMYQAKKSGKNKYFIFNSLQSQMSRKRN